jgi:thiamine-monophosphate kinase
MDNLFENRNTVDISSLGEFALIDHLTSGISPMQPTTFLGVGDDAALISTEGSTVLKAISTDQMLENVHFDMTYTPLKHLGYKLAVINISDICAMNAIPRQFFVSIALSNRFSLDAVETLYAGIRLACEKYEVDLAGGDTSSSRQGLILTGTAVGEVDKARVTRRSGSQPGDLICVTGDLGGAYMGLQLLEREKAVYLENPDMQPDLSGHDYIVGRQLKPEARLDMVKTFQELDITPTSMIDISDGLSSELLHLSKASGMGMTVHEDKLPIDQGTYDMGVEFGIDATTAAMNGGEDYELLFTLSQSHYEKIKHDKDITVIGYVTDKSQGNNLITGGGQAVELKAQGWKSF